MSEHRFVRCKCVGDLCESCISNMRAIDYWRREYDKVANASIRILDSRNRWRNTFFDFVETMREDDNANK